jgi:hypothetical protein
MSKKDSVKDYKAALFAWLDLEAARSAAAANHDADVQREIDRRLEAAQRLTVRALGGADAGHQDI